MDFGVAYTDLTDITVAGGGYVLMSNLVAPPGSGIFLKGTAPNQWLVIGQPGIYQIVYGIHYIPVGGVSFHLEIGTSQGEVVLTSNYYNGSLSNSVIVKIKKISYVVLRPVSGLELTATGSDYCDFPIAFISVTRLS